MSLTQQRILVVDDEENIGLIVQRGLKKLPNFIVKFAQNADQALAYCEESPFDLVITDYIMPGQNGIALAAHIKKLYPKTVILMLTARNDDELYRQAKEIEIQRVLDKPVEINEIRKIVSQALSYPSFP